MSAQLARRALASALLGLLGALALAAPAHAEGEVDVNMGSLDSSMDPGETDDFTIRMRNQTDQERRPRVVFTIRLNGLEPRQVTMIGQFGQLRDVGSQPGEIRLSEQFGHRLNAENRNRDSINLRYFIRFDDSAPGGRAQVIAQAIANNQVLGTDQDEVDIEGQPVRTTEAPPTTQPPNTATEPVPTFASVDGRPTSSAAQDSGTPILLYVLGALLVLAGGAMLWLMLRNPRPRPALVGGGGPVAGPGPPTTPFIAPSRLTHPVYPPPAGAPMPRRSAPPTAAMPTVNQPYGPQHAVDPWADSAEDPYPR
jgi:hypothetical protein